MMSDSELILGELKEFKRATLERLQSLEKKMDESVKFQWKLTGGVTLAVFLVGVIVRMFK